MAYTIMALFGRLEGKHTGKLKVSGTLQFAAAMAGWCGPFKANVFDKSGQVTFTDCGTFELTRIAVEPLD